MKIVVDTNRIIAALVKDSTTRSILFDKNFEFITPDYTITEINEHKDELKAIAKLTDEEFDVVLALMFEHVEIIPELDYKNFINECKNDISDPDDIPILAAAIASKADGIWAHDPHFKEQKEICFHQTSRTLLYSLAETLGMNLFSAISNGIDVSDHTSK